VVGEEAGCESKWLAREGEYNAPLNLYRFSKGIKLNIPEPRRTKYSRPASGVLTVMSRQLSIFGMKGGGRGKGK
jgi:hypothetical protein